jgi:hypothetical protein
VAGHALPLDSVLELTTALHDACPDLPILLATSLNDAVGAMALAGAGISEVVSWPIKATEMAVALQDPLRPVGGRQASLVGIPHGMSTL